MLFPVPFVNQLILALFPHIFRNGLHFEKVKKGGKKANHPSNQSANQLLIRR
jgi:hypothetical protein